jgi:hypothetical protein
MTHLNSTVSLRRLMLAPLAATLAAALAASAASAAERTLCVGSVKANIDTERLVVPEGVGCSIEPGAHVKVSGDVEVRPQGRLAIMRRDAGARGALSVGGDILMGNDAVLTSGGTLSVHGNVTAPGAKDVRIYDSATIDGNLSISSWKRFVELDGIAVHGTVSIQNSDTGKPVLGGIAVVGSQLGELVVKHNRVGANISDNRITRRLECAQNTFYAFRFVDNTVAGKPVTGDGCQKP